MAEITYRSIADYPRGTLAAMLSDAYSFEPAYERDFGASWKEDLDDFFYDHPKIAENCGFITVLDVVPIGFVTWNPTGFPVVEIGHNCILSKYKGNGCGKAQMREAVRRIAEKGAEKITVVTSERLVPARRMYESTGFAFVEKQEEPFCAEYAGLRLKYELVV